MKMYEYINSQGQSVMASWRNLPPGIKDNIRYEKKKRQYRLARLRKQREQRAIELRAKDPTPKR